MQQPAGASAFTTQTSRQQVPCSYKAARLREMTHTNRHTIDWDGMITGRPREAFETELRRGLECANCQRSTPNCTRRAGEKEIDRRLGLVSRE